MPDPNEASSRRSLRRLLPVLCLFHAERTHQRKGNVVLFPTTGRAKPRRPCTLQRATGRLAEILPSRGRMNILTIRGPASAVFGGWDLGAILTLWQGSPFELVTQTNTTNAFTPGSQRVNVLRDP